MDPSNKLVWPSQKKKIKYVNMLRKIIRKYHLSLRRMATDINYKDSNGYKLGAELCPHEVIC